MHQSKLIISFCRFTIFIKVPKTAKNINALYSILHCQSLAFFTARTVVSKTEYMWLVKQGTLYDTI